MELFDEVKNRYFHIIFQVLNECKDGMKKDEIIRIVDEEEFQEKVIGREYQTFDKFLLNEYVEEENYNVLKEHDGKFYPSIHNDGIPALPVRFTNIEKAWLRALSDEPKLRMILSEGTASKLKKALGDFESPIKNEYIEMTNISRLPEIVSVEEYENNFRALLEAILKEKPIRYCNKDRLGNTYCDMLSLPIRLEYSLRDGRFRVSMFSLNEKRPIMANICSMSSVEIEDKDLSEISRFEAIRLLREKRYSAEPVVLEVTDRKAAMERCFMSFSGLERSSRCIEKDKYEIKLSYYVFEEDEIIRKILALGPYVKVLSPQHMVDEVIRRIRKAIDLS